MIETNDIIREFEEWEEYLISELGTGMSTVVDRATIAAILTAIQFLGKEKKDD